MATPPAVAATVAAQTRQQGSLREYVNQKLAPFLKQALRDSLEVDAEYPLQWLGEHLINQSFLYENNPDTTGIKERFFYSFEKATPPPQAPPISSTIEAESHFENTNEHEQQVDSHGVTVENRIPDGNIVGEIEIPQTSVEDEHMVNSRDSAAPEVQMSGETDDIDGGGNEDDDDEVGRLVNGDTPSRQLNDRMSEGINGGVDTEMEGVA